MNLNLTDAQFGMLIAIVATFIVLVIAYDYAKAFIVQRLLTVTEDDLNAWVDDMLAWGESSHVYHNDAKRRKEEQERAS